MIHAAIWNDPRVKLNPINRRALDASFYEFLAKDLTASKKLLTVVFRPEQRQGERLRLAFSQVFFIVFRKKKLLNKLLFFFPPTHSNHALGGVGVAPGSIWQYSLKILANLFLKDSFPLPRPFLSLKSQSKSRENVA